jgi:hypothetical protein
MALTDETVAMSVENRVTRGGLRMRDAMGCMYDVYMLYYTGGTGYRQLAVPTVHFGTCIVMWLY